MKMISFCNNKGGVGKTTLTKNCAYKLALDGNKVLLIDLDPQATLSMQFVRENFDKKLSLIKLIGSIDMVKIEQLIQSTTIYNIEIIIGNHELNKASALINSIYPETEKLLIANKIYEQNQNLDKYDYILVDYPPTVQELAQSFLLISDLIIVPLSNGLGGCKGILDLKNSLNKFARDQNFNVPEFKIILNNITENDNLETVLNWLKNNQLDKSLSEVRFKKSEVFPRTENLFDSIWTNSSYWRQKQVYEQLVNEIK